MDPLHRDLDKESEVKNIIFNGTGSTPPASPSLYLRGNVSSDGEADDSFDGEAGGSDDGEAGGSGDGEASGQSLTKSGEVYI